MTVFLVITYLLFPVVSAIIFKAYSCEHFDNGDYLLRADYNVDCRSDQYKIIVQYASLMIFVYPMVSPTRC